MDIGPGFDPADRQPSVIYDLIQQWSARLKNSLQDARTKLVHSGDKGDVNEIAFRQFLRENLSPKYRIGQGEIIDHRGGRSRQTDVVVADEEQPFPVNDSPQLMIIEGVVAAAEVKTSLNAGELRDCIAKGRAFKALEPVLGKAIMLASPQRNGVPNSDIMRFYRRRPFFVFAYEGAIDQQTLLTTLVESERDSEVPPIDAVFILDRGFALNLWDGNGALTYKDTTTDQMTKGWISASRPEASLIWLLFWLNGVMPLFSVRSSPMMAYLVPGIQWIESDPQPNPVRKDPAIVPEVDDSAAGPPIPDSKA